MLNKKQSKIIKKLIEEAHLNYFDFEKDGGFYYELELELYKQISEGEILLEDEIISKILYLLLSYLMGHRKIKRKRRIKSLDPIIMASKEYAVKYANFFNFRFDKKYEKTLLIKEDHWYYDRLVIYCKNNIKGRWKDLEEKLIELNSPSMNVYSISAYFTDIIGDFGISKKIESIILEEELKYNGSFSYKVFNISKKFNKRWPMYEKIIEDMPICTLNEENNNFIIVMYALEIIKGPWRKAEKHIRCGKKASEVYENFTKFKKQTKLEKKETEISLLKQKNKDLKLNISQLKEQIDYSNNYRFKCPHLIIKGDIDGYRRIKFNMDRY
ncbi:hypothetical protein KAR91_00540 [Candidatus Pacearchaeota archaeon]|nr:hypothetical protein [Candidatus Pacearchaeota archaeon]